MADGEWSRIYTRIYLFIPVCGYAAAAVMRYQNFINNLIRNARHFGLFECGVYKKKKKIINK